MSAEHDVLAETGSEDGGLSLAKVESDEMDLDTESDTTPTSHASGASSTSSANAWGETSYNEFPEHEYLTFGHPHMLATLNEVFHDSMASPFSVPQAASSATATPITEAPQYPESNFAFPDAGSGTPDLAPYLLSTGADHPNGPESNLFMSYPVSPHQSFPQIFMSAPSEMPSSPTDPLPTATENVTPTETTEPPAGSTAEDETAQGAGQNLLEDHHSLAEVDHTDGSDEDWLALPEDPHNIFNSDNAQGNGTLHVLSQASSMASYYDHDDLEEEGTFFSVSFFFYHWKHMYESRKPDYPKISKLANDRAKVQRPDKITIGDVEQHDYQGIHWSRFQTTKQVAREVRRMTYRNLRNLGPAEQNFGTKAFKAKFPGAVIPSSDCFFRFSEMDMNRRPDFAHFQLRHNLSATSKNAIFYSYRPQRLDAVSAWDAWKMQHKTIVCFNPETGTEVCALDVNKRYTKSELKISKIHALTAGNGVLVAGSYEGVYAMKSLSADFQSAPIIGSIATGSDVSTNHIHTHLDRQSGLPRVVFDSNNKSVRILDCTANQWVACHKYPYQVNCSVTSPDGRLRLLNGDDCDPIVANAETGETLAKLVGHYDFGFACDWAADGITMATGHQDGLVKVWDARKLNQSIQTIAMEQAGCRSLQFSPLGSGKRVLVLAEPADFVHIVDAQTFESKQTIDFFGEVSGISMPPDGSKLYIANADAKYGGLMEFARSRDGMRYNRRPFRVPDLEDEHEELVDLIVDGVQPARRFPKKGDTLEQHVQPFMHGQGLPFAASSMIEEELIDCQRLFLECLNKGGGQGVTASGRWSTLAETFGIPAEKAASFGRQLYEYWQDNLASYETSLPLAQMRPQWQRASGKAISGSVANRTISLEACLNPYQCRRDYSNPRRRDFKIGRKSESLDWLSESDIEDDARVKVARSQRGRQWAEIDGELMI